MVSLEARVARAADEALAEQGAVDVTDVLVGIGWLAAVNVESWRKGRLTQLQDLLPVGPDRIHQAVLALRSWADGRGLRERGITPLARGRAGAALRFGTGSDPGLEEAIRVCWVRPDLPARAEERLVEGRSKAPDLVVIDPLRDDWTCHECGEHGGPGGLLLMEGPGPICLGCADLDHLVFLPAGDATLTRRAKKASALSAVVVRFARARKRYERQGILVEPDALHAAELSCLADEEIRARHRDRDARRRAERDEQFTEQLRAEIALRYPGCPSSRAAAIAAWTGTRNSGRVGRSASGRALQPRAIELAVTASVRHQDTGYDALLMSGVPRAEAREQVREQVQEVLRKWRDPGRRPGRT